MQIYAPKILRLVFFLTAIILSASFFGGVEAQSRSYQYDSIIVDIEQNEDSTMMVTEEFTYRFNGTYFAVFRDISLENKTNIDRCKSNPNLQCGGFEFLQVLEVLDNDGNKLLRASDKDISYDSQGRVNAPANMYAVYEVDESSDRRFRIQWLFAKDGREFNDETFKFTVQYVVFGSLGYFDDYDLLYWNAIFGDREVPVKLADITINYPGSVEVSNNFLQIPGHGRDFKVEQTNSGRTVKISKENILPYDNLTILHRIPKGLVKEYASVNLNLKPKPQNIVINDLYSIDNVTDKLSGIPPGEVKLDFGAEGRVSKTETFSMFPGEVRKLTVELDYTREEYLKRVAIVVSNILGLLMLPIGVFVVYRLWSSKGKDVIKKHVIVPEYRPPENALPHILGSLKNEQVDIVDITASIIDLAYRGYIKIREFGGKSIMGIKLQKADFELIKLKDYNDLTEPEKELMDALFTTKDRTTTKDLANKFYRKIPNIRIKIYDELVNLGYFTESPDKTRLKYIGIGFAVLALGIFLGIVNVALPLFIGMSIAITVSAIVLLIVSKHMPSKTKIGSEVFHKILGFKMYMETAEKYRVQNLTPETFEKYLSYAIIFGIEKQWAEKFKDIYKGTPSWYEGSSDTFTTIYLANALANFSTATATAMTVSPSSSGSASGGGWSGGGGFSGGFSGGGGGGGGGGAW